MLIEPAETQMPELANPVAAIDRPHAVTQSLLNVR